MEYIAEKERYSDPGLYRRCGRSGLKLPQLSIGLWHNFGELTPIETQQSILRTAFDNGITHFDLANNYGPPYGEAERNFGKLMDLDWRPYRDELIISTKAGYDMWDGPYGDFGSRKYLIASLNQSLKRMRLDYVDIFYHHRPDPETPLEETMGALSDIVRSGKALYVGLSNYPTELMVKACRILRENGTPCLINQNKYSILMKTFGEDYFKACDENGTGIIAFSPLAGGMLSSKYLNGIPNDSRMSKDPRYFKPSMLTKEVLSEIRRLNGIAQRRGQSLVQMALQWVLHDKRMTSAVIGASRKEQLIENLNALKFPDFTDEELKEIGS